MTIGKTRSHSFLRRGPVGRLIRSPVLFGSALFLAFMIVAAAVPGLIASHDPLAQNLFNSRQPPFWWPGVDEAMGGWLGTDALGRDTFSRLVHGARVSLVIGTATVTLALVIGIPLGLVAGWREGLVSDLIMRSGDAVVAIPTIFLAIAIIAIVGPDLVNLIIVLAMAQWVLFARVVRADVLSAKEQEYAVAAKSVGFRSSRVLFRHVFPNIMGPLIVLASLAIAQVILAEAALSFLGLGVQPPAPTWGGMLSQARNDLNLAPWTAIFPGLAITGTVLAINLIGDWLRDLLDPRVRGESPAETETDI